MATDSLGLRSARPDVATRVALDVPPQRRTQDLPRRLVAPRGAVVDALTVGSASTVPSQSVVAPARVE